MRNRGEWEGDFLLVPPSVVPELASGPGRCLLTLQYLL